MSASDGGEESGTGPDAASAAPGTVLEADIAVPGPPAGRATGGVDGEEADVVVYAGDELCALCRIEAVALIEYVRHGVVVAEDERGARFTAPALRRALRAARVQREFEVELDALALVVDLFERLDAQRREIDVLRGRLLARRG